MGCTCVRGGNQISINSVKKPPKNQQGSSNDVNENIDSNNAHLGGAIQNNPNFNAEEQSNLSNNKSEGDNIPANSNNEGISQPSHQNNESNEHRSRENCVVEAESSQSRNIENQVRPNPRQNYNYRSNSQYPAQSIE